MRNVHVVGRVPAYETMFLANGYEIVESLEEADLVQFTGGEDVTPDLYGETRHPRTHNSEMRDAFELDIYNWCKENGTPMTGICRGGQFLNVANGGAMWQDVDGHAIHGEHIMIDIRNGEMISVSSTHHQMMIVGELGELICAASESSWKESCVDGKIHRVPSERGDDVEVVWYPASDSLCYQPHPEFFGPDHPCQVYYFKLIRELIGE